MVGPPVKADIAIPMELLVEANREYWIRGRVRPRDLSIKRIPLLHGGTVVGFYTPHRSASGYGRLGPFYVRPDWRRHGLVISVYASMVGPMMACIERGNEPSARLHARAGFVPWRPYGHGEYWRRP